MITKESGKVGAVDEKVAAAKELGIEIVMIGRPKIDYGNVYSTFSDVIGSLQKELGIDFLKNK
jgi:precorrin-6A/cobalt-precorrin-6A reductase